MDKQAYEQMDRIEQKLDEIIAIQRERDKVIYEKLTKEAQQE